MNVTIPFYDPEVAVQNSEPATGRDFIASDFSCPWESSIPPATAFTAYSDTKSFCFRFDVQDSDIYTVPFRQKSDVALGDRVEIFFSGDSSLSDYYCIEISPEGKVLDYQASYYRVFNEDWNLANLTVESIFRPGGYRIEGKIPLSFLQYISLQVSSEYFEIYMGLYRANYQQMEDGTIIIQWISWIKPDSIDPDFHIPSSFCKVKIQRSNRS